MFVVKTRRKKTLGFFILSHCVFFFQFYALISVKFAQYSSLFEPVVKCLCLVPVIYTGFNAVFVF